jgi:hypothetical protein
VRATEVPPSCAFDVEARLPDDRDFVVRGVEDRFAGDRGVDERDDEARAARGDCDPFEREERAGRGFCSFSGPSGGGIRTQKR